MKRSVMAAGIVVSVVLLIASGGFAFAAGKGGGSSSSSAPQVSAPQAAHGGSAARVYTATPPRFQGAPVVRSHTGQQFSSSRLMTGQTGKGHDKTGSAVKSDLARHHPEPGQTGDKGVRDKGKDATKWSHNDEKGKSRLDLESTARLRNWRGKADSLAEAKNKHDDHHHHHHDHDWWHHHCPVIVLVGWGYWGWDAGWWYPAWGYDPYYSDYEYDGPVYGYDGLPPDQVIANVQGALQREGYFPYAVDGVFGPITQTALQRYQQDHGLPVTGAIDPPTLSSLGFIH